jgi:NAD(P)-dependent dehydrogenase (short-subunit alcohol dehydrogenase family)
VPRLQGRKALVTGASSGIGRAIAVTFAHEGAAIAVGGRNPARIERTIREIEAASGRAVSALGDISETATAEAVVERAASDLGGLDVVVNNAGIDATEWVPLHEWPVEDFDRILATNLRAPFLVSKFAMPHLLRAGRGAFLHISSVCAITVWAGDCAYDISKAALNMLSDHIAVEYGPQGITSNTLMPGQIVTELYEEVKAAMPDAEQFEETILARHPIGRFGSVDEVAEAAVLLCSGAAPFLTGANISIDGAYSRV